MFCTTFIVHYRYIATGDSSGNVKFFDTDLKLSNWYVPAPYFAVKISLLFLLAITDAIKNVQDS